MIDILSIIFFHKEYMEISEDVIFESIKHMLNDEFSHSLDCSLDDDIIEVFVSSECFLKGWLMTNLYYVSLNDYNDTLIKLRKEKIKKLLE